MNQQADFKTFSMGGVCKMPKSYKSVFHEEITIHMELRRAELSNETYRHYERTVKLFDDYLFKMDHRKKEISESIVEQWIKEASNGISINTTGLYVHYIRQLLLYLINCGYPCFIPKTVITRDTYIPYLYSDEELEKIFMLADSLKAPHAVKNVYIENEMPMLLRLLLCCGLRVGEALNIKTGDIDFQRNLIVLRVTKKYKQRLVPFEDNLADIIYRYCAAMEILTDSEAYLFPTIDKNVPLSSNAVRNYFKEILKKAEIQNDRIKNYERGACIHCFRHTFAVRSFDKNARKGISAYESVPFLSTYLGHDSLYETEKYLKYSGDYFSDTLTRFEEFAGNLFPEVTFDE